MRIYIIILLLFFLISHKRTDKMPDINIPEYVETIDEII